MTAVLWAAVTAALLMSLASLALSALVTSRYRQVHARISSGSIGTSRFAPSGPVFPAVGTPVPEFSAITTAGARIGTDAVSQQGSAAVFLHTQCQVCKDLLPEISGFLAELAAAGPSPLAVISGEREQIRDYLAALPAAALTVSDPDGELADSFDIHTFPTVLVFDDGKVSASGSKPAELLAAAR